MTRKPNVVLILNDDMGYLRHRLLRRRDRDAQPRPPRGERPALLAVLQHGALQPVARVDAHGPASAPDRRRHPHLRLGARGLRRQPQPSLRDDPAGAQAQRLPHLHERQVARRIEPHEADRHLAAAARLRRVLRHHHRRRQLLRSQHADARQRERRARGAAPTASSTPTPSATRRSPTSTRTRASTPDTPFFEYVAYTAPHWPLHAHDEDIAKYRGRFDEGWDPLREERLDKLVASGILDGAVEADRARPDAAAVDGGRAQGVGLACAAWRSTRRRSTAWTRASAASSRALEQTGQLDDTLVIFLADNGACAEDIPEDVTIDELVDKLMIARSHTRSGEPVHFGNDPTACPAPRTRTRATAPPGRTSPTRRSASTSTGSTKAASPRRSSRTGRTASRDKGGIRHAPGYLPDIMATILDATGTAYPDDIRRPSRSSRSKAQSLVPVFDSDGIEPAADVLGARR